MMPYDKIPATRPDRPFPDGDIVGNWLADEWCETMEGDEWDAFMSYVDATYVPKNATWETRVNHIVAEDLCKRWDAGHGNYAKTGFKMARSFAGETQVLPPYDAELRLQLIRMKQENTARDFARAAWNGMERSHPRAFMYHERLYNYAAKKLELNDESNTEHFLAGLSLPYMLSVAAGLAIQAKQSGFTSLSSEKLDLRTNEFGQYFTDLAPLASSRPDKRLIK